MHYNLTAVFVWAADCILLSVLLLPLWLRNKDRSFILLWSVSLLLMGLGLAGLIAIGVYGVRFFTLPIAALVAAETLSTAGLLSLYGAKCPLRFMLCSLGVWLAGLLLFHLSGFGSVACVASYYLADIGIAVYAVHFLLRHADFEEVGYHRATPLILSVEAVVGLVIAILFLIDSPALPDEGVMISVALISGFLLFSVKIFHAVWLSIEKFEFHLRKLAFHDPLTGIFNRRGFFHGIEERITYALADELFAYLMIDVDHFKRINDRFGHDVGDQALVAFAHNVLAEIGKEALFGRTGGEEFAVFIKVDDVQEAISIAERIRARQASTLYTGTIRPTAMTVSIGIAFQKGRFTGFETLLWQSDRALYEAKNQGRNCVVSYSAVPSPVSPEGSLAALGNAS
ncbi:UNVERIFIED_ORG: diguanylate cyclase (GGDEF)-like protein [Martelella mediterranea]